MPSTHMNKPQVNYHTRPDKSREKEGDMRGKKTEIWAYLDGKKLVEVIQAALDNNMMVDDMKKLLIKENPKHEVTFKIEK